MSEMGYTPKSIAIFIGKNECSKSWELAWFPNMLSYETQDTQVNLLPMPFSKQLAIV